MMNRNVSGVCMVKMIWLCLGDFNGYIGRHIDEFDEVHGSYGIAQRTLEERTLLEFCWKINYVINYHC